jgi:hypothetical protein
MPLDGRFEIDTVGVACPKVIGVDTDEIGL